MEKLTINHIASILVEKNGVAPKDAEQFVAAMFDVIQEGLETDKQVKVRGLGTFKIVDVEPRESVNVNTGERVLIKGHSKISFTPDTSMKETVNKPFSQFETVVLNEGVEFPETETATETEPAEFVEQAVNTDEMAEEPVVVEEPVAASADEPESDSIAAEETVPEMPQESDENAMEETLSEETQSEADDVENNELENNRLALSSQANMENSLEEDEPVEEATGSSKGSGVFWWVLLVVVLVGGSGYFGYWLASSDKSASESLVEVQQPKALSEENDQQQAVKAKTAKPASEAVEPTAKDTVKPAAPVQTAATQDKPAAVPVQASQTESAVQKMAAKYDALDTRVRTGAYCIVGEETSVKVKAGETVKIISKRALGPGMECYVEVFNNLSANAELKEGQTIRIPKLELRKRVFKKAKQ